MPGARAPTTPSSSTYREHGHALARGVPLDAIMAEMFGKATGCSRGRGGSMHLFDAAHRLLRRQRHRRRRPAAGGRAWRWPTRCAAGDRVTACFFGDGAVAEGEFHECAQPGRAVAAAGAVLLREQPATPWAPRWPASAAADRPGAAAPRYGMPAWPVDGMDVLAVERRRPPGRRGGPRRRRPALPGAAHLPLPRPLDVRPRAATATRPRSSAWKERDPIDAARPRRLRDGGELTDEDAGRPSRPRWPAEIDAGGRVRRGRRRSSRSRTSPASSTAERRDRAERSKTTYREAMREAIREAHAARRPGLPHGRGRRPRTAAASRSAWGCSRSSAPSGSGTPRCRSRRSSAPASAPRSAGCGRSSRS